MVSIEHIELTFKSLEQPDNNRWHLHTLLPGRLHLSVNHEGRSTVFIEGDAHSFGRLPMVSGVEHRDDAVDVETGNLFKAVRVTASNDQHGNQAIAFIAYEISRTVDSEPDVDNATLLGKVNWILKLLGVETSMLSSQRQRGLVAECLLLRRLFQIGRVNGIAPLTVIDRWWGPIGGKRDFAAAGITIEVKSTASNTRTHHVASIDQLEPLSAGEEGYLYSIGIKSEPTAHRKLPIYLADVANEIVDTDGEPVPEVISEFYRKLVSVGYDRQSEHIYASEPGILPNSTLPPKLFHVDDIDRVRLSSFKGDQLPSMVTAVSYEINITASPLSEQDMDAALLSLLVAPSI